MWSVSMCSLEKKNVHISEAILVAVFVVSEKESVVF